MNQFPGLHLLPLQFLRQNIFCFQLVGNINGYRSGWKLWIRKDMLQNMGFKKAWTCMHSRNGNEPNARNKNLFRIKWIECNGVNFGVVTKFKFRYSIAQFLLFWFNQLTGLHPPLLYWLLVAVLLQCKNVVIYNSLDNNGYVQICINISKFLSKYSEIHDCDYSTSVYSFSFALDLPKQKNNIDCVVYTCIYALVLPNRFQSVAVTSLLAARYYIGMVALEITPEEYDSTRLPLDNTVEINKQKLSSLFHQPIKGKALSTMIFIVSRSM